MKCSRVSAFSAALALMATAGLVLAQDDGGFDALLREISQPSPTQQPAKAEAAVVPAQPDPAPAPAQPAVEPAADPLAALVPDPAPVAEPAPAPTPAVDPLAALVPEPAPAPVEPAPAAEPAPDMAPAPAPVVEPAPAPVAEVEQPAAAPANRAESAPMDAEAAKEMERQNVIRLQAKEKQAKLDIETGLKLEAGGEYDKAIADLKKALGELPDRPPNRELRNKATAALADAYYRRAKQILDAGGNFNDAKTLALDAQKYGHKEAPALIKRIDVAAERRRIEDSRPIPVDERPEYLSQQQSIADLLAQGRALFKIEDYNGAEKAYEQVLLKDEYNVEAMRFLRKIDENRLKVHTHELEATRAAMIDAVRSSWTPPIRQEAALPEGLVGQTTVRGPSGVEKLRKKMESIMFPLIDFREANILDVVKFLNEESVNLDKAEGVGVNIILNLSIPQAAGAVGAPAPAPIAAPAMSPDELGLFGGAGGGLDGGLGAQAVDLGAPAATAPAANTPTITLSLRRVSLLNAIKYITEVANLKYRIDEDAVIITPEGVVQGRVVTRLYPVQPTFMDTIVERGATEEREGGDEFVTMTSAGTNIRRAEADQVKKFFENAGVPFPVGTSISYNTAISQLIVANTPENLELFERIIAQLDVVPKQVEIEARFVEIAQDDMEELGFQWILTDNYEFAANGNDSIPMMGRERAQVNRDSEGFTKGLRFFELGASGGISANSAALSGNPIGDIASIATVLTNPEVKLIIQALSQHGGTDLLSAPRVTTRSGVNAQIQVVREIIYPTEFETTSFQGTLQISGDEGNAQVPPAVITPGSFETRQTGVILNVTPTVGPDGYTIDLTLVPEVTELVDWINYGTTFGEFQFFIPQPVFATRQVTTSIVIWDGQTVVMGGLIREDVVRYKDKIPLLGDIPLLGRLFRSEGERTAKKNLMIFVTAKLVDPSGKQIRRAGMESGTSGQTPPATPGT